MFIVPTCLTVDPGKITLAVTFITSKRILTANSIINARIVKALVEICEERKLPIQMNILLLSTLLIVKNKQTNTHTQKKNNKTP